MKLKQSAIDKFLAEFKLECDSFKVDLNIVSSHRLGSHYYLDRITLDRSQIEAFIDSSNGDALQVWQIIAYHEMGHHRGCLTEESCWDWLEQQSHLDQETVSTLRSQVTWGSPATVKGRNWHLVKDSLNSEIIKRFVTMNRLSAVVKEAAGIETPGRCWYFLKTEYQQSLNLEKIVTPLLPNSKGYLLELCHSQTFDHIESEIGGLLLWREIASLL